MHRLCAFAFILLALFAVRGFAQDSSAGSDSGKSLDQAREKVAEIRKRLNGDVEAAQLDDFRDTAISVGSFADALAADRAPRLEALDARIAELGAPPAKGAPPEAPDIAAQRAALDKERTVVDAEIKRAKLLSVDAQQMLAEIAEARRGSFLARLSQRTASPLTPTFWRDVGGNLAADFARLNALRFGVVSATRDSFAPDNRIYAIGGIAIGVLLIVFGRWWAERALMRLTADRVPHGRLRRSALALAVVVVATVFTGFGAQAIVVGLDWHDALSDTEDLVARAIVSAVFFGSFVAGLGRALLSPARPSWRLTPVSDEIALALRPFPWLLGAAVAFSILLRRINSAAAASLSATIAASLVTALMYSLIIVWALVRIAKARGTQVEPKDEAAAGGTRPLWIGLAQGAYWIGAISCLVAAASGFVAFAHFTASQLVWTLIVGAAFYLVVHLIEDVFAALVASRKKWMHDTLGVETRTLDQVAVVLSGAFRVVAFLFALSLVLQRFGNAPGELLARGTLYGGGALRFGEIEITPAAVLGAFAVFLLGMVAIRALKRWLHDRYLPTTALDPAMRSSVTTLLGYACAVVVFAFALSELGLSVERIAWVASALSVGIGFGLQAIVQNFVSGLILLVERPVKVGDWIALGDVEGDIRRINVRATEIQMGDRSTMIVPNSELITKTVRNVTLGNSQSRVQIRLPMPLDTDADKVIAAMREAFASNGAVLEEPAMSITVDGIQNATLIFVGVAFIPNPRQSGAIRSDILLDILARLRAANVEMVKPQEVAYRALGQGPSMPVMPTDT